VSYHFNLPPLLVRSSGEILLPETDQEVLGSFGNSRNKVRDGAQAANNFGVFLNKNLCNKMSLWQKKVVLLSALFCALCKTPVVLTCRQLVVLTCTQLVAYSLGSKQARIPHKNDDTENHKCYEVKMINRMK
jgi:hypothetical protein